MPIPTGKLPQDILERMLRTYTTPGRGVVVGPSIGEDATAIDIGDRYLLLKTDPITFVAEDIGTYAININANDIATMGGRARWFLATILLPERHTTPELVEEIFRQLSGACERIGASLCGGHTEITPGLDRPVVIGMMVGEVAKERLITTGGARPGDDIILTKAIALEATSIMAREKDEELKKVFGEDFVARCRELIHKPGISVVEDADIAMRSGRIHSMHDPTEGGLATGLYEVARAADVGLIIYEESIPILEECRSLSTHFGLDPLGLIASGSLLIMVDPGDTERVISTLKEEGIPATLIGKVLPKGEGLKMRRGGQIVELPRFERDEITRIL